MSFDSNADRWIADPSAVAGNRRMRQELWSDSSMESGFAGVGAATDWMARSSEGSETASDDLLPSAAIAARLIAPIATAAKHGIIYIADSERSAEEIATALRHLSPGTKVLLLPPWDCLPYDRVLPSRQSMGRRMLAMRQMCEPAVGGRVIVASPEA